MYLNQNLRTNLKEWRNRLYNTFDYVQIKNGLNAFLEKAQKKPAISSILLELYFLSNTLIPTPFQEYKQAIENEIDIQYPILQDREFNDLREQAMHHYQFLKVLQEQEMELFVRFLMKTCQNRGDDMSHKFVRIYVDPLIHYIHDQLDEENPILYLLIRYKTRCEWFYNNEVRSIYENENHDITRDSSEPLQRHRKRDFREERLNKDLRKFLFDQGIDSAFLDPLSPSGKADVVALLDSQDPLVLEIKIFDREKNYHKERIISGFRQIVSYSNDYNKPIGYLLVFNMDKAELDLVTKENDKKVPSRVVFAGKIYFIIFVNIPPLSEPASKRGQVYKIQILEEELTSTK
jgi:hypothetical protein